MASPARGIAILVCLFPREPSFLPPVRRAVASKCGSTRPVDRRGANSPVVGRVTSDMDVYRTEVGCHGTTNMKLQAAHVPMLITVLWVAALCVGRNAHPVASPSLGRLILVLVFLATPPAVFFVSLRRGYKGEVESSSLRNWTSCALGAGIVDFLIGLGICPPLFLGLSIIYISTSTGTWIGKGIAALTRRNEKHRSTQHRRAW